MSEEIKERRKELAKLKREASELAGEIHDIVEEKLWTDYPALGDLSARLAAACERAKAFQAEHGL